MFSESFLYPSVWNFMRVYLGVTSCLSFSLSLSLSLLPFFFPSLYFYLCPSSWKNYSNNVIFPRLVAKMRVNPIFSQHWNLPVLLLCPTFHNPSWILWQCEPCHSPSKILSKIWIQYFLCCWLIYVNKTKVSILFFTLSYSLFWLDPMFSSNSYLCTCQDGPTDQ